MGKYCKRDFTMLSRPFSFQIESARPTAVAEALERKLGERASIPGLIGVLFLCGDLVLVLAELAREVHARFPTQSWLLVPSIGVLSAEGEHEDTTALVGILLSDDCSILIQRKADSAFGERLADSLQISQGSSACVFLRTDSAIDDWLVRLKERRVSQTHHIMGCGSQAGQDLYLAGENGVEQGTVAALRVGKRFSGQFLTSSSCRLLCPLAEITHSVGRKVIRIGQNLALEHLQLCARELGEHPLVLLAVARGDDPLARSGRTLFAKAIVGVDPLQGALILSEELREGTRVAFAVRDAHVARTDLDTKLRALRRSCGGSSPAFGFYFNCAGRGRGLYGASGVDARLVKAQFPKMPFVGLSSAFELSTHDGEIVQQVYGGVLGVFSAPS